MNPDLHIMKYGLMTVLVLVALAAAGCNTVKGVGKDLHDVAQNTQEWIEGGSTNSDYIPPG